MPLDFDLWSLLQQHRQSRRQKEKYSLELSEEELQQGQERFACFLGSLEMGRVWVEGPVAVVSLRKISGEPLPDPWLSASEALRRDVLEVQEAKRASVPVLEMENRDPEHYVLVPSGQVFPGGMQTRGVAEEVALAPRQKAEVPVYCVERRRWGGSRKFSPDKKTYRSPARVHRAIAHKLSQGALWETVHLMHAMLQTHSPSESLADLYEEVNPKIEQHRLWRAISRQLEPDACGVLLFYAQELKLAEAFAEPSLAREQLLEQLRCFLIDVMLEQHARTSPPPSLEEAEVQQQARRVLQHLQAGPWTPYRRLGAGQLWTLQTPQCGGQALCCKQQVIHFLAVPSLTA